MARVEPAFKLKTTNLSLFVLHVHTTDMVQLKHELNMRYNKAQDFFSNTPVALDLSGIENHKAVPDFADLVSFMLDHGMRAAGVVGGSAEQRAQAVQSGLGLFPDSVVRAAIKPESLPANIVDVPITATEPNKPDISRSATVSKEDVAKSQNNRIPARNSELQNPVSPIRTDFRPTMLIDKPVRTGQRIYAEGANLVVLAAVNAGSELIADGDIHIYAPLRGRAIAGAKGNEMARIYTNSLEAELISIAGCFKVFENGIPEYLRDKPVQAFLEGSNLIIQPLLS